MLDTPSRAQFAALREAAQAIASPLAVGCACAMEDGRVAVFNAHLHGLSRYAIAPTDRPAALVADGVDVRYTDAATIAAHAQRAMECQLLLSGARSVISAVMPAGAAPRRVWVALAEDIAPTRDIDEAMAHLAETAAELLDAPEPDEQSIERLRRLERAAMLLRRSSTPTTFLSCSTCCRTSVALRSTTRC